MRCLCLVVQAAVVLICLNLFACSMLYSTTGASSVYFLLVSVQVAQCQDHFRHRYRDGMEQENADSSRAYMCCHCSSYIWLMHPMHSFTCSKKSRHCASWVGGIFQLAQILKLHPSITPATCTRGIFLCQLAHLCTHELAPFGIFCIRGDGEHFT